MSGYTPLFGEIVTSSIWNEDAFTCKVWVTLLALADAAGNIYGSEAGFAPIVRITKDQCCKAIQTLSSPDPDSRSKEEEGRRIIPIDGGWHLVNHRKYRQKAKSHADYLRKWREEKRKKQREEEENINSHSHSNNETQCNSVKHSETLERVSLEEEASKGPRRPLGIGRGGIREGENKVIYSAEYLGFWKAYPRKEGKGKAWESWKTQNPPLDKVLETLEQYKKTDQWK